MYNQTKRDYIQDISNPEVSEAFNSINQFKKEDDRILMRQIDKYFVQNIKDKEINQVTSDDFDIKKFELKNERLSQMSNLLIRMRMDLFLKFTKQFMTASN